MSIDVCLLALKLLLIIVPSQDLLKELIAALLCCEIERRLTAYIRLGGIACKKLDIRIVRLRVGPWPQQ